MLLDMYPKGPIDASPTRRVRTRLKLRLGLMRQLHDSSATKAYGNLWIQGGPRARHVLCRQARTRPALNKIPLVKWDRAYAYVSSTHMLLPRGLNLVYDEWGGEKASGCLLHAKFLDTFTVKADEELDRSNTMPTATNTRAYKPRMTEDPDLWCKWSEKYINWRQLEILGLMSKGNWADDGVSVGFVMLCHTALDRAAQVTRHWAARGCPVVVHVDKRVNDAPMTKLVSSLPI